MASALGEVFIKASTEPLVKVLCNAIDCEFNLATDSVVAGAYCNLKHITIGERGMCNSYRHRFISNGGRRNGQEAQPEKDEKDKGAAADG